jgi:hypothetical protein
MGKGNNNNKRTSNPVHLPDWTFADLAQLQAVCGVDWGSPITRVASFCDRLEHLKYQDDEQAPTGELRDEPGDLCPASD